ncbi:MAG: hypothetical protein HXS44_17575 [Theionarchaea archaeon]|nr:hypothetical protein [Theionarchaea archaeon]
MRTMGEITKKIQELEKEHMPLWLVGTELDYDLIEKDLKEYAYWLLHE